MCLKRKHFASRIFVIVTMMVGASFIAPAIAMAQDKAKATATADESPHASRHSGQLGVLISSSPGKGVHVADVIPGSPAAKAGIRQGDYIMDINDQEVSTPEELQKKIKSFTQFDTIDVTLWRDGQDVNVRVGLASESKQLSDAQRTWLGVALSSTEEGMKVDFALPDSPADVAGLQEGDVITKIGSKKVKSAEQLRETVQELGPGKEMKLTILRNGAEQTLTATLGTIDDAPVAWFYEMESHPQAAPHVWEELLNDLRAEIQSLKNDVQELKSKSTDKDVSQRSQGLGSGVMFVVQRGYGGHGYRGGYGNYGGRRVYGGRGYYGAGNGGLGLGLGGYYGSPYYSGYSPYYSSGYPYSYYSFGGRPYYYGGYSPYGYRGGVRIGPNFSVRW